LKEIGNELGGAREAMGVSLEEAATDLKLKPSQLENIEKGNRSAFKDVFELKQIIKDYAKYLSLEYEKLEDEFNEFVFEYTSKIPVAAIKEADNELEDEKKVISPYTTKPQDKKGINIKMLIIITVVLLAISIMAVVFISNSNNGTDANIALLM
jgi:cytoskeletal protein RodZ